MADFDIAGDMNALLREWQDRKRILGRETAAHPKTLRRVMAAMDALGPSEQGDVIQSLVFELVIARRMAYEQCRDTLRHPE